MRKEIETERQSIDYARLQEIALEIFTDPNRGFATRGDLRRELEMRGIDPALSSIITGSFPGNRRPDQPSFLPQVSELPVKKTTFFHLVGDKPQEVTIYFNPDVIKADRVVNAYISSEELRKEVPGALSQKPSPKKEKHGKKKEKSSTPEVKHTTAVIELVPFGRNFPRERLTQRLQTIIHATHAGRTEERIMAIDPGEEPLTPTLSIETLQKLLEQGATEEELRSNIIPTARANLLALAQTVRERTSATAQTINQSLREIFNANKGRRLSIVVPIRRSLISSTLSQLKEPYKDNPNISFQEATYALSIYKPHIMTIIEDWGQRYETDYLETRRDILQTRAQQGDSQAANLLKLFDNREKFSEFIKDGATVINGEQVTQDRLDTFLAGFIFADSRVIKAVFADLLRILYPFPESVIVEDNQNSEIAISAFRFMTDQFTPEDIFSLLAPMQSIDHSIHQQRIDHAKEMIRFFEGEKKKLNPRTKRYKKDSSYIDNKIITYRKELTGAINVLRQTPKEKEKTKPRKRIDKAIGRKALENDDIRQAYLFFHDL